MSNLEQILLGVHGTIVSVFLFVISYRQTVGARKQRARNAADSLVRTMLRRVVQEDAVPRIDDIEALRRGLARDFEVKLDEVISSDAVLTTLFTRISDSDFIPRTDRDALLERVREAGRRQRIQSGGEASGRSGTGRAMAAFTGLLALVASVAGAFISGIPFLTSLGSIFTAETLSVFATSIAAIAGVAAVRVVRQGSERDVQDSWLAARKFEWTVADVFLSNGHEITHNTGRSDYDFSADVGGRKLLVEVKAWTRPQPKTVFKQRSAVL